MKILIQNAAVIVTADPQDRVLQGCDLLIEGNQIAAIGKLGDIEADRIIDATDLLVFPGLINTHHHLYQTFTRNIASVQNLELFDWLTALYELWKNLDEEMVYFSTLTGVGELLKYGCTTCFDHHYVFPQGRTGLIDAQVRAAKDIGVRFVAARGSMSRSKKDGGLPPDSVVQSIDDILCDSARLIDTYHDATPFSMTQIALAPCSPFSVTPELMRASAALARKKGVRLHTHLAETLDEQAFTEQTVGMRPLAYMQSLDWVGSDVWFAHGIHFNEQELQLLAKTQTGVAHCPVSNMKLASGVAKIAPMLALRVPVGLAVDGSASNDGSNLLEELRVGYLLQRLTYSEKAPSAYEMLKLATVGGAKLLGRTDIGCLEVGKAADLFIVNAQDWAGGMDDPKSILCTVGHKRPVEYTIVNGVVVVERGRLTLIDEQDTWKTANALAEKMRQQP